MSINIQAAQSNTKHIDPSQNSLLDTPLHSREKKSRSMHQNTDTSFPNQETLTIQLSNPTHWEKHSNLNKMKRKRNTQQVKEHEKCPPSQTKEEEIGNLPGKEFRIMIIKVIQNLENKMESQINSLETRIKKMQEKFNKDIEEIKRVNK